MYFEYPKLAVFVYKGISKYTKENLPVQCFCCSLSTNGLIFARSSLDCHIFSALSIDTHIGYSKSHMSMEGALKMWQSSEDLAKIRPFLERLEPKYWTDIFSFVYFWNSFVNKNNHFWVLQIQPRSQESRVQVTSNQRRDISTYVTVHK